MDPELGVMCFQTESLCFLTTIVNYTCHPVVMYARDSSRGVVSADWPGALAEGLRRTYYVDSMLVFNGACGNINSRNLFDPDYRCDHIHMGRVLAETAKKVIEKITFEDGDFQGVSLGI